MTKGMLLLTLMALVGSIFGVLFELPEYDKEFIKSEREIIEKHELAKSE
jgi:hypothetical protein